MNRRQLAVLALAVAFGLTGCLGSGPSGAPSTGTATGAPADVPTDSPTATAATTATNAGTPTETAATASTETPTSSPTEDAGSSDDGSVEGTSIDYDGDAVTVRSETGQVVSGTTDGEPGSEITVRLTSQGDTPFIKQQVTTVRDDGSFEASFDFSDIEPGTTFSVTVYHDGEEVASAPGEVTGS